MIEYPRSTDNLELWPGLPKEPIHEITDTGLILSSFLSGEGNADFLIKNIKPDNLTFGNPEKDDEDFHIFLPFSDLNGWVNEKETLSHARHALQIERLEEVRSLSNVAYTYSLSEDGKQERIDFVDLTATRLLHSLVVAKTMEAIMRNNDFTEEEINIGIAAALIHDRATPALGDATKTLDQKALHEEDHWSEGFDEKAWEFLNSIGATQEIIDDIIHNDGPLGKILDIADRIGYVMIDLWQTGEKPLNPQLGNIYKDVVYNKESGEVYFKDSKRLKNLLYERGRLFRYVYIGPDSQASDFVFASLLAPYYSPNGEEGKLSPQDLRAMTDMDLIDFLSKQYGFDKTTFYDRTNWSPQYETYDNRVDALKGAIMKTGEPETKILGIKRRNGFNPATDFKCWDDVTNSVLPFREVYPQTAQMIENWSRETTGYLLVFDDASSTSLTSYIKPSIWG